MRGRPLRFLAVIGAGWIALRLGALWPPAEVPRSPRDTFVPYSVARLHGPPRPAEVDGFLPYAVTGRARLPLVSMPFVAPSAASRPRVAAGRPQSAGGDARILALFGIRHFIEVPDGDPVATHVGGAPPPLAIPGIGALPATLPSRWRMSGWLIARPGGGDPALVPQLGGAQAGARISYSLDAGRRVAGYARLSAPLGGGGAEAALGVEWRALARPLAAYAELRRRADGDLAPTVGVYGGMTRETARYRLDGYGQAGYVGGDRATGFVEGQARIGRRIGAALDAGAGMWGAAQRGAARLDIGPTLGLAIPLRRGGARVTLDWRHRIAGDARPGSGPALSLGTDF